MRPTPLLKLYSNLLCIDNYQSFLRNTSVCVQVSSIVGVVVCVMYVCGDVDCIGDMLAGLAVGVWLCMDVWLCVSHRPLVTKTTYDHIMIVCS